MTDRRAGPNQGPYVDKEPRARNEDGTWRKKRSDAGKEHPAEKKPAEKKPAEKKSPKK